MKLLFKMFLHNKFWNMHNNDYMKPVIRPNTQIKCRVGKCDDKQKQQTCVKVGSKELP